LSDTVFAVIDAAWRRYNIIDNIIDNPDNIIDNPFCPSCGSELETPLHFFLECSFQRDLTIKLISDLQKIAEHALQNVAVTLNVVNITEILRLLV